MNEFRAKVRMHVDTKVFVYQNQDFIVWLTDLIGCPALGVLVTDINQIDLVSMRAYEISVHVRVKTPPEFDPVEPEDYCRIHMTDEEFGLSVVKVDIIQETN